MIDLKTILGIRIKSGTGTKAEQKKTVGEFRKNIFENGREPYVN